MTQLGLGFGQLMQQGIGSGMNAYRADQQLAMARIAQQAAMEQDALRMEAMREDLTRRRRNAEQLLVQDEADRNVLGAMFSAQAPTANPDGTVTEPDWTSGIDARVMAAASPRVQDMLFQHKADRLALQTERAKLTNEYNAAKASGALSYIAPERWDKYINMNVPGLDFEKAPESIRERAVNKHESTKQAMVDMMTIAESDGSAGPPAVDTERRAWLSSLPAESVEIIFKQQWLPAEKQRREQKHIESQRAVLGDAYGVFNDPNATPQQRSKAQAVLAQLNAPMPVARQSDPLAASRVRWSIEQAKSDLQRAEDEYRAFNADAKNADGRMAPPTADELKAAETAGDDIDTGLLDLTGKNDYGEKEVASAKAKVSAWKKLQESAKRLTDAYRTAAGGGGSAPGSDPQPIPGMNDGGAADFAAASKAAVRAMTPSQARPVPPQLVPAQVPTASPATPAMADPAGQVNRKPPADLFREAVSELQDERGGFDVVSLVRRMRDAGVDPETVKALMAEHGVGVVGGTP